MSKVHIHCPQPTNIFEIDPEQVPLDRFGKKRIYTDCCKKMRLIKNCEMLTYEYYDPYIRCKEGKGCKR